MEIKRNPVNWFEIPVNDLERARHFYETVFGVELTVNEMETLTMAMAMFPMEMGAPGAAGSLVKKDGYVPSRDGTKVYFSVPDVSETLIRVEASGGRILMPKTSIGEWGFIGQFEDTEGNLVALHAME